MKHHTMLSWVKIFFKALRLTFFILFTVLTLLVTAASLKDLIVNIGIYGEAHWLVIKLFDEVLFSGEQQAMVFWMVDIACISASLVVMLKKDVGLVFRLFLIVVLLSYPLLIHGLWLIRIML